MQPHSYCEDITLQCTQIHTCKTEIQSWSNVPLFSLNPHINTHVSQYCNAVSGECVNNLDENDASRLFSSQLTPVQHQLHISADAKLRVRV